MNESLSFIILLEIETLLTCLARRVGLRKEGKILFVLLLTKHATYIFQMRMDCIWNVFCHIFTKQTIAISTSISICKFLHLLPPTGPKQWHREKGGNAWILQDKPAKVTSTQYLLTTVLSHII